MNEEAKKIADKLSSYSSYWQNLKLKFLKEDNEPLYQEVIKLMKENELQTITSR